MTWLWQPLLFVGSGVTTETGESGEDEPITPAPEIGADILWPVDDLRPRWIGIHPCAAPIGGGVALTAKEATIDSGAGHWRIVLGAIPVKTRTNILIWRGLEAECEGRGRTFAIPIYDGKRAPWPGTPGGAIDAESVGEVPVGSTGVQILPNDIADIQAGMHFSVADRLYRITRVDGDSTVFDCTIWPEVRDAWPAGQALEFRHPLCRVRLADDLGMSLELDGHKRSECTVEFVEAN